MQDRCAKNYFVHKDTYSNLWRRIPWDLEDAFAVDVREGTKKCSSCRPGVEGSYCVLSCPAWNHPFACVRAVRLPLPPSPRAAQHP